jgi:hypothetical protein
MGMGLMTVRSEQGPTTCHDLVRLSAFFPAQLFRILVTLGQRPLPVPIPYHTLRRFSQSWESHLDTCTMSATSLRHRGPGHLPLLRFPPSESPLIVEPPVPFS